MDARQILADWSALRTQRSALEGTWREIARLVLPRHDTFGQPANSHGGRRSYPDPTVYDDHAVAANELHAALLAHLLTPSTREWHGLAAVDEGVAGRLPVRRWCEQATQRLFKHRQRTNHAAQLHEAYLSIGAFGPGALYIEDVPGYGPTYEAVPIAELWFSTGRTGEKDKVIRSYRLRGRVALARFPGALPDRLARQAERAPEEELELLHCVYPNPERDPRRADRGGWRYASAHLTVTGEAVLERGGYRTMPYAIGRYVVAPGEPYGRSPAFGVLPTIRSLNKLAEDQLVDANRRAQPTYVAVDDDHAAPPLLVPNAINYGWLAEDGTPRIRPVEHASDPAAFAEAMAAARERIDRAFLVRLYLLLRQGPQITATETLQLAAEKGIVLAPIMGRLQAELLRPMIVREVDILNHMGELPPDPPAEIVETGGLRVEYTSPLASVLRAGEAQSILETAQALAALAQFDPAAADVLHIGRAAARIAEVQGVPAELLATEQERAERAQGRQQDAQAKALLAAAPVAADVAKALPA